MFSLTILSDFPDLSGMSNLLLQQSVYCLDHHLRRNFPGAGIISLPWTPVPPTIDWKIRSVEASWPANIHRHTIRIGRVVPWFRNASDHDMGNSKGMGQPCWTCIQTDVEGGARDIGNGLFDRLATMVHDPLEFRLFRTDADTVITKGIEMIDDLLPGTGPVPEFVLHSGEFREANVRLRGIAVSLFGSRFVFKSCPKRFVFETKNVGGHLLEGNGPPVVGVLVRLIVVASDIESSINVLHAVTWLDQTKIRIVENVVPPG